MVNPRHYLALLGLGAIALEANNLEKAADLLTTAERLAPQNEFIAYNLAVFEEARGERDRAIRRLEALTKSNPEYEQAMRALTLLRQERGRDGRVR